MLLMEIVPNKAIFQN